MAMSNDDFLDGLIGSPEDPRPSQGGRFTGLLVVPAKAASGKALTAEYGGGLRIPPVVFEHPEGVLANPEDFPPHIKTVADAMAYLEKEFHS
jgi:hypothetical protein